MKIYTLTIAFLIIFSTMRAEQDVICIPRKSHMEYEHIGEKMTLEYALSTNDQGAAFEKMSLEINGSAIELTKESLSGVRLLLPVSIIVKHSSVNNNHNIPKWMLITDAVAIKNGNEWLPIKGGTWIMNIYSDNHYKLMVTDAQDVIRFEKTGEKPKPRQGINPSNANKTINQNKLGK